ncbi:MAG: TonB-dependent receptor [Cytophagales bacterium]|nr:TonB-dependent receptor [Cytophagales bacterium]
MYKIILIILLATSSAFSQTLKGIVRESGSHQPLAGAHVLVKGTGKGTIAQAEGNFIIASLQPGAYEVEASFVGYTTAVHAIEVKTGVPINIVIELTPGNLHLADVMISSTADRVLNTLSPLDIQLRPTNTSQDILRIVPGLFIAQHAGGGKAEQIFLRGFDIDHGTDINLEVDGLPVNMVSHAHGQGYSDLHFLIPELVQYADFDKGPYFADKGDFTTAGYVDFQTKNSLERNFIKTEGGQFGTFRGVAGVNFISSAAENKTGYVASEFFRSDGFFESPQNFNRFNLTGKFSTRIAAHRVTLGASYFTSAWDASGQIPERAVSNGEISRFGAIDNTEGGETSRINLYAKHSYQFINGSTFDQQVYGIHYNFNLFSNFTFYLNDPVNGDQIQQKESRMIYGYKANYTSLSKLVGKELQTHIGGGVRYDNVGNISLSNTVQREFRSDVQRGDLTEGNANVFINETLALSNRWSMNAAVRLDYFTFGYTNQLTNELKKETAAIVSPKLNLTYRANDNTSVYVRSGTGFHSNDARVVVEQNAKEILPRAFGVDVGVHKKIGAKFLLHAAVWRLDLNQEFVYVGDAGIVEASGKTKRQGIDFSIRYQMLPWLFADTDVTLADPKAKGVADGESYIPLAPKFSSIGGLSVKSKTGWNGSLRYRYLVDRAANETNTVVADGYFLLDAVLNYTKSRFEIGMSVENLLNKNWNEAQFDTESRLFNEVDPVSEIHFTPGTPFFAKLKLSYFF